MSRSAWSSIHSRAIAVTLERGRATLPARARRASAPRPRAPPVSAKPSVPRSCSSVVIATCQPPPISPSTFSCGHLDVREEDLVELRLAGDLAQRPHLDPGRLHVHDQVGEPVVPLRVGVAAGEEDAEVGDVRERRPDLLAVDDEVAVLGARARADAREVGARARLREALAPDLLGARGSSPGAAASGASVPWAMIVGPAMPSPITPTCGGASARASSSRKIAWCV